MMFNKNTSALILYRQDGKVLLQHRTKDAPTFPDYWAFFGGGIEKGESAEQALQREIREELGYEVSHPRLFRLSRFSHKGSACSMHIFIEDYNGSALTLGEGQGMGWFPIGEVDGLKMNDHDRSILKALESTLAPGI